MSSKEDLRKRVKARVKLLTEEERRFFSQLLMEKLEKHPRFVQAKTVMLFHSLPDEVNTHELLDRYATSKQLLLPVVQGYDLYLSPYRGKERLVSGYCGISEPSGERFVDFLSIDLIVVPGVAFDPEGHRLGRGRGFYDRFLSQPDISSCYKLGLCFPCQLQTYVPTEKGDVNMDEVLC